MTLAMLRTTSVQAKGDDAKAARRASTGVAVRKALRARPVTAGQKRTLEKGNVCIPRALKARLTLAIPKVDVARTVLQNLPTVVINLDRRPDRMEACAARLNARCPGLRFTRFSATDGKATPIGLDEVTTSWHTARNVVYQKMRSVRKGWNDLDSYQERRLPLSAGERGCSSSHIRAWRHCLQAANGTERPLLVLEDDAAPTAEFSEILVRALSDLPADAGLLYLGYSQAASWRREVSAELVESEYVWTTVGYIIWPVCARVLLSQLPINEPVDNWMAGMGAEGRIKAYCVRPKIVLQADAWNINSDVAHSDEHYWGPDSDIQHTDAAAAAEGPAGVEQEQQGPQQQRPQDGFAVGAVLLGDCDSESDADEDADAMRV